MSLPSLLPNNDNSLPSAWHTPRNFLLVCINIQLGFKNVFWWFILIHMLGSIQFPFWINLSQHSLIKNPVITLCSYCKLPTNILIASNPFVLRESLPFVVLSFVKYSFPNMRSYSSENSSRINSVELPSSLTRIST